MPTHPTFIKRGVIAVGGKVRGKLISIEGVDGCGKSTHAKLLAGWLRARGYKVVVTGEPTDGPVGEVIRRALQGELKIPVAVEALLFAADRVQHVTKLIRPALDAGKIVVTERYTYSSLAYQSTRGLPMVWLEVINRAAPKPDLAILIDVPAETAIARIMGSRKLDTFEKDMQLQRRVRENYLRIAKQKGMKVVDGGRAVDEVQADVRKFVEAVR